MSWIITGDEKYETDPYRSQVSLLLHGDGTNGSTTITDSSPTPKTVTAFGNAQISTAENKFGGASIAFDGSGDYLSIGVETDWTFLNNGTAFTAEAFVRGSAFSSGSNVIASTIVNTGSVGVFLALVDGKPVFRMARGSSGSWGLNLESNTVLSTNEWYHLAFVLTAGGMASIYLNGILDSSGTLTSASLSSPTYSLKIGALGNGASLFFNGYIDDFRITKGVARYTSNFTPPTAPFPDI